MKDKLTVSSEKLSRALHDIKMLSPVIKTLEKNIEDAINTIYEAIDTCECETEEAKTE
jgi:hypothetical protein